MYKLISVDRLGSSVSDSFQIFALTVGGVLCENGNCSGEDMSEGEMSHTLHQSPHHSTVDVKGSRQFSSHYLSSEKVG